MLEEKNNNLAKIYKNAVIGLNMSIELLKYIYDNISIKFDILKNEITFSDEFLNIEKDKLEKDKNLDKLEDILTNDDNKPMNWSYYEIIKSLIIVRMVTHFEVFLNDLTEEIIKSDYGENIIKEEIGKKKKKFQYNKVYKYNDINELKNEVVEDYLNNHFSNKNIKEKMEKIQENYLNISINNIDKIEELIQTRNIIVHNSGKIDEQYIDITGNNDYEVDDKRKINEDYIYDNYKYLREAIKLIFKNTKSRLDDS